MTSTGSYGDGSQILIGGVRTPTLAVVEGNLIGLNARRPRAGRRHLRGCVQSTTEHGQHDRRDHGRRAERDLREQRAASAGRRTSNDLVEGNYIGTDTYRHRRRSAMARAATVSQCRSIRRAKRSGARRRRGKPYLRQQANGIYLATRARPATSSKETTIGTDKTGTVAPGERSQRSLRDDYSRREHDRRPDVDARHRRGQHHRRQHVRHRRLRNWDITRKRA